MKSKEYIKAVLREIDTSNKVRLSSEQRRANREAQRAQIAARKAMAAHIAPSVNSYNATQAAEQKRRQAENIKHNELFQAGLGLKNMALNAYDRHEDTINKAAGILANRAKNITDQGPPTPPAKLPISDQLFGLLPANVRNAYLQGKLTASQLIAAAKEAGNNLPTRVRNAVDIATFTPGKLPSSVIDWAKARPNEAKLVGGAAALAALGSAGASYLISKIKSDCSKIKDPDKKAKCIRSKKKEAMALSEHVNILNEHVEYLNAEFPEWNRHI